MDSRSGAVATAKARLTMDKEKRLCLPLLPCATCSEIFCSTFNGSDCKVGRFSAFGDDSATMIDGRRC